MAQTMWIPGRHAASPKITSRDLYGAFLTYSWPNIRSSLRTQRALSLWILWRSLEAGQRSPYKSNQPRTRLPLYPPPLFRQPHRQGCPLEGRVKPPLPLHLTCPRPQAFRVGKPPPGYTSSSLNIPLTQQPKRAIQMTDQDLRHQPAR